MVAAAEAVVVVVVALALVVAAVVVAGCEWPRPAEVELSFMLPAAARKSTFQLLEHKFTLLLSADSSRFTPPASADNPRFIRLV